MEKTIFDIGEFAKFLQVNYPEVTKNFQYCDIPLWFYESEKKGDEGITELANELLSFVKNMESDIKNKNDLIKFLSYRIYNVEDINKLLELRLKFLLKEAKIDAFIKFLAYVYYQNNIISQSPKIIIEDKYLEGSYGASYNIMKNEINFFASNFHMHLNSMFLKVALAHEMAHYLYTIERDIYNHDRIKESLTLLNSEYGTILNLMEDVRVDHKIISKFPFLKDMYVKSFEIIEANEKPFFISQADQSLSQKNLDSIQRKQLLFLHLLSITKMYCFSVDKNINRYLPNVSLTKDELSFVDRYLGLLEKVKNAETVKEVYELIKQFIEEEGLKLPQQQQQQNLFGSGNGEGEGQQESSGNQNQQSGSGQGEGEGESQQEQGNGNDNQQNQEGKENTGEQQKSFGPGLNSEIQQQELSSSIEKENDLKKMIESLIENKDKLPSPQQQNMQSDISEKIEGEIINHFEQSIKEFIKENNVIQRIAEYEEKQKLFQASYGSPIKVDLYNLTKDEGYFFSLPISGVVPEDLQKSYMKGVKDGVDIINVSMKKNYFYKEGKNVDLKRYMNLLGKLYTNQKIDGNDLAIFKKQKPVENEVPEIDCVVDTSGSMSAWGDKANQVIAYLMGLQDSMKTGNVFKLNIYLIRGVSSDLCINLDDVLKKNKVKNRDKFTKNSLKVVNAISYSGGWEGLSAYLQTAFLDKKPKDHVFFITDAHFCNVNDWDLLYKLKKQNISTRPYLIGFYVINEYERVSNVESYLKNAFDEHHIFSVVSLSKVCKRLINKAIEIQLKNGKIK